MSSRNVVDYVYAIVDVELLSFQWNELLVQGSHGEDIRQLIDDAMTHDVDYYAPEFELVEDHGTHHLNVLSRDGAAVAMTSSINYW